MRAKWLFVGLVTILLCNVRVISQTHYLPSDLIFPVEDLQGNQTSLMRIDAQTMSAVEFYSEPSTVISLQGLKWSPDGRKLAIARRTETTLVQVCVLNRDGLMQQCMAETTSFAATLDSLMWSDDGKRLYFAVQKYISPSDEMTARLIEADALTGQTIRILHEVPNVNYTLTYVWNADLSSVLIGNMEGRRASQAPLLQLFRFTEVLQAPSQIDILSTIPIYRFMYLCRQASPSGMFFAFIEGDERSVLGNAITIVDTQGKLVVRIDSLLGASKIDVTCPVWSWNEEALYFLAGKTGEPLALVKYSLIEHSATLYYQPPENTFGEPIKGLNPPYALSYDNGWIAGRQYVYRDGPTWQVAVLGPNGEYHTFLGNWRSAGFPLWMPPLDE